MCLSIVYRCYSKDCLQVYFIVLSIIPNNLTVIRNNLKIDINANTLSFKRKRVKRKVYYILCQVFLQEIFCLYL